MNQTPALRLFLLPVVACLGLVSATPFPGFGQTADAQPAGRAAFDEAKCQRCHAVSKAGIRQDDDAKVKGPDLSEVSSTLRTAAQLQAYLERTSAIRDKKHPFPWRGDEQALQRLIAWVLQQQKEVAPSAAERPGFRRR